MDTCIECVSKMESCLTTFLKEVGRNLAHILDKMSQVSVTTDLLMLYADVGLHLSSHMRDQLNLAMQQEPVKPDNVEPTKRVPVSTQYGLSLALNRVVDIVDQGMQEQLTQKYNYSRSARVGITWLAEQVTLHFLKEAMLKLNIVGQTKIRGVDISENWMHRFIGSQEMY